MTHRRSVRTEDYFELPQHGADAHEDTVLVEGED